MEVKGRVLVIDHLDAHNIKEYSRQGMSLEQILEVEKNINEHFYSAVKEIQMPSELEEEYPGLKQDILEAIKNVD